MGRIGDIADLATAVLLGVGGYLAYRAIKGYEAPSLELPAFEWPTWPSLPAANTPEVTIEWEWPTLELPTIPSPPPPEIPAGYIIEEQRQANWQAQTRDYRNNRPGTTKKTYHKPKASIIHGGSGARLR